MARAAAKAVSHDSPDVDAQTYNRFVSGVQPVRVELAEVSASALPSDLQTVPLRVESKFLMSCPQPADGAMSFTVEARLRLNFLLEEGPGGGREVGHFDALYRLDYQSDVPLSDALLQEFARRNAPVNVWPFMRELVMNLTQRFGWTGFVLPSFFIPASAELGENGAPTAAPAETPARKPRKSAAKMQK